MTATIKFQDYRQANEFATIYQRAISKGHVVFNNEVKVYDVTDSDKDFIDRYVRNMNVIHNTNNSISNTISKKDLQAIIDNNGLDSFSVDSKRLNQDVHGCIIVDEDLVNYFSAFSDVIRHLY